MALIEIENLSVTFRAKGRDVRAVEGVSLAVEARESFGLVGESGSGKSTILRAICGLAPVTGGTIRIAGEPLPTPRGARLLAGGCRWCSRTPMPACTPATPSTAPCRNRWRSTAAGDRDAASCRRWPMWACPPASASAIRTSCRAGSASASPSPAR